MGTSSLSCAQGSASGRRSFATGASAVIGAIDESLRVSEMIAGFTGRVLDTLEPRPAPLPANLAKASGFREPDEQAMPPKSATEPPAAGPAPREDRTESGDGGPQSG